MFILQFAHTPFSTVNTENTFQYILYEGSNDIQVNYLDVTSRGAGQTTAGIENSTGTVGLQYDAFNTPGRYRNLYVRYSRSIPDPDIVYNKLYYPHIASDGDWETEICLINTDSSVTVRGTFNPYGDDGRSVSDTVEVVLPPLSRKEITVGDGFAAPSDIGHIIFESTVDTENITGYLKFYRPGEYRVAIPAVSEVNTGDIFISHIASTRDWWTGISLVNTTDSSRTLTIEFDNGQTKQRTLAAGEHQAFLIKDLFGGAVQPNLNSAVIRNAAGIIGLELFGSAEGNDWHYLSGILLNGKTAKKLFFPHIASDGRWWTGIAAFNPSAAMTSLQITPYSADGTALTDDMLSLPLESRRRMAILAEDLELPVNAAWLTVEAATPIAGFELFGTNDGNQLAGYSAINIQRKTGNFMKIEDDGWTGIALVNSVNRNTDVTLVAYDDDGAKISTATMSLKPYEKRVHMAEDLFSGSIIGATYIRFTATDDLVAFQLNSSSDEMMLDGLPAQ